MKKSHHFIKKSFYALFASITLIGSFVLNSGPNSPNSFNQITYAKKTKKAKKVKKVPHRRWNKAKASIYLDLGKNDDLIAVTNDAIKEWNETGAFTFTKTKNRKKAQITVVPWYNSETRYAGYTHWRYYVKNHRLVASTIQLNTYYLCDFADDAERYQQVLQAIEHELGHAMGLDHNTKVPSVMDTEGRYPIQPVDVKNVKKLYHK
ncbi:matrixin family metalloprotease [Lactobacillus apis]|uniref:matrixin family metalloprotease n=1 Tax=Lactobacillus apis TaxID=303541 RepID=UPI00164F4E34|nr:matrixin family metalloprotease [Lactobacillus apis]MBC6361819.1 matrixin family metalloprotease [Lactobacillus apis]